MNLLPVETIEIIASHLQIKDALSLSKTNKKCYQGSLQRIWNYPEKHHAWRGYLHVPTVGSRDISHLPIKRIYTSFLKDDDIFMVKDLPQTIKELYVDFVVFTKECVLKFRNEQIQVYYYTDVVLDSEIHVPDIFNILREMGNVKVLTGSFGCRSPLWGLDLPDLLRFEGIAFKELDSRHFQDIRSNKKETLIDFLISADIEKLYLNSFKFSCLGLLLTKVDILRMRNVNIVEISNSILEWGFGIGESQGVEADHPWKELQQIKTLKQIHFQEDSILSLWALKNFAIQSITIHRITTQVNDVRTVKDILDFDDGLAIHWCASPEWRYQLKTDITVSLKSRE